MNNNFVLIIIALLLLSGVAYAAKMKKTDKGLVVEEVKTYYVNRIIWGDTYSDHKSEDGVHNTEVIAFGDGWEYSTTTDDDGSFKVEVKPNTPFKIKASDGNMWAVSDEISGVPEGTTNDDRL